MTHPDVLRQWYAQMLRIRLVEERIAALYAEQEMRCPVHLSVGQEAVAVGSCVALTRDDYAMSGHRSHAHYLAKGGNLRAFFAELYGKATGCSRGKGGSMHLIDLSVGFLGAVPIVGNTIPIAVGAAFSTRLRDEHRVTVIFLGEAATEEGAFHESMNFATLWNLPMVFVCENNLYSVYSPLAVRQASDRDNGTIARGYGMESVRGDGNDVQVVADLTGAAVQKARAGGGPTFVELSTYRWREHCGPNYDNHLGYRTEREFLEWKARDPIVSMEQRLRREGCLDDPGAISRRIEEEIDDAVAFARASPWPPRDELMAHVYA